MEIRTDHWPSIESPGYLAPLARGLADSFRILEPLQRGSGGQPLTVRRHVDDLREMLSSGRGSTSVLEKR